MKILHVTNWYPHDKSPNEAVWIERHIKAIAPFVSGKLLHLTVNLSNRFKYNKKKSKTETQVIVETPIKHWYIKEIIFALFLVYYLLKLRVNKRYDIINFHIAYPMLTYWHWIKKIIKTPIVITEHWSAYHYSFGVEKPLPRIQRIFRQNIPVITVSKALAQDIKQFSKSDFQSYVIPNIVNPDLFHPILGVKRQPFFFMVSQWKEPKNPFMIFDTFKHIAENDPNLTLKVAGHGPLWSKMVNWVEANNMKDKILLLGSLQAKEIAVNMQTCRAFLHCSEYETFSVVCAEAVCCGSPVIASGVGGILEVVNKNQGVLIKKNSLEDWVLGFRRFSEKNSKNQFNINSGFDLYSKEKIGKQYFQVLKKITGESL